MHSFNLHDFVNMCIDCFTLTRHSADRMFKCIHFNDEFAFCINYLQRFKFVIKSACTFLVLYRWNVFSSFCILVYDWRKTFNMTMVLESQKKSKVLPSVPKFSPLAPAKVVKTTTLEVTSDGNFVKMATLPFQWCWEYQVNCCTLILFKWLQFTWNLVTCR